MTNEKRLRRKRKMKVKPRADRRAGQLAAVVEDHFEQTFARAVKAVEQRSGSTMGTESKFLFHRELWNSIQRS